MGCEPIFTDGKVTGFMCSIGRKPRPRCYICGKLATSLCDQRIGSLSTCDKLMCNEHRHRVEKDTDYCDEHYEVYQNDEIRRKREKKNKEPEQLKLDF